jgi:hypothetical protein
MSASNMYLGLFAHNGANTDITSLTGLTGQVSWGAQGFDAGFAAGVIRVTDGGAGDGQLQVAAMRSTSGHNLWMYSGGLVLGEVSTMLSLACGSTSHITWNSTVGGFSSAVDTGLIRHAAGVVRASNGTTDIRGFMGGGTPVASASPLPLPTGRVFHVTGTANFSAITSTNFGHGAVITLIFDGVLTITASGTLLLVGGTMVTTANDTLTLAYDGTVWYETGRTVL